MVTHEMGSAFRIGTRMAMLYQGKDYRRWLSRRNSSSHKIQ